MFPERKMKKFSHMLCFFMFFTLLSSCERADYTYEILDTYWDAKRNTTSGAVIDGNMWSAASQSGYLDWQEAVSYCKNLNELGYSDWKLPTVDKLRTLIRNCSKTETGGSCPVTDNCINNDDCIYSEEECRCDLIYNDQEGYYSKLDDHWLSFWSSDNAWDSDHAWVVYFGTAEVSYFSKDDLMHARCVRKAD